MKKSLFALLAAVAVSACAPSSNPNKSVYDADAYASGGDEAPYLNERTMRFMESENAYANVDTYRPKTDEEKTRMAERWESSRVDTKWEEYRGTMVKIQILLGSSDLREMRLQLMQNSSGGDINANSREVLTTVSEHMMRHVCGRNVKSTLLVYDRPSFNVVRPTPFFDYRVEDEGATMREYGFRCVY